MTKATVRRAGELLRIPRMSEPARDADAAADLNPYASPTTTTDNAVPLLTACSVVLLVITIVIAFYSLGLAVGLTIFLLPAYTRTLGAVWIRKTAGKPIGHAERIAAFVSSVVIVWLIGFAGLIACFSICLGGLFVLDSWGPASDVMTLWLAISGLLGFFIAGLLYWKTWPRDTVGKGAPRVSDS